VKLTVSTSVPGRRAARLAHARPAPPGPTPRKTYHHGNLRGALIAAATALLESRGPLGVTLRGAARAAGVSQAAPYRHFRDKQAMLAAVAESGFRQIGDTVRRAVRPRAHPMRRLEQLAIAWVRFAVAHPSLYRLMFSPAVAGRDHPALRQAALEGAAGLAGVVVAAQRAGALRTGDPEPLAFVLLALLHGVSNLLVERQIPEAVRVRVPSDRLAAVAVRTLITGIARVP